MKLGFHPCKEDRYKNCGGYELTVSEVLKLISENPGGLTRCQIEEMLSKYTHSMLAQCLLDLVERGQVEAQAKGSGGWVTIWVAT